MTQPVSPSQPHDQGIRKAARELGVSQPEVQRAVKIASLTPEVQAATVDANLDDNQSALLAVAKENPERQLDKVSEIAREKKSRGRRATGSSRRQRKAAAIETKSLQDDPPQDKIDAAVRNIVALIIDHVPKPSLVSLTKSLRVVGSKAHISEIEKCMREQRPDLFDWGTEATSNVPAVSLAPAEPISMTSRS